MKSARKIFRLFSRLNIGGPAIHVVNLSVGLEPFGYKTTLVVGSPELTEGSMEDWAVARGADLYSIPTFQAPISPFKDLVTFVRLFLLFLKERPLIVHTHTFKAGLLGRTAAWLAGVPIIVHTYHGHLLQGYWSSFKTGAVRLAETVLSLVSDHIIAVSSQVAKDLVAAGIVPERKISVIELGFNISELEAQLLEPPQLRADLNLNAEAELVGIVGRLVPVKAVDLFLQALGPLLSTRPNLHLAIIGDGSESESLKALATQFYIDRIHFCGWRRPVIRDLPDLDVCVCSSRNEGTSVSIIECILAKVPVVSTNVGGMGDLLGGGKYGELVEYDAAAIQARVVYLLDALAESSPLIAERVEAASEIFKHRFSVNRLLAEVDRLYNQLSADTEGRLVLECES